MIFLVTKGSKCLLKCIFVPFKRICDHEKVKKNELRECPMLLFVAFVRQLTLKIKTGNMEGWEL